MNEKERKMQHLCISYICMQILMGCNANACNNENAITDEVVENMEIIYSAQEEYASAKSKGKEEHVFGSISDLSPFMQIHDRDLSVGEKNGYKYEITIYESAFGGKRFYITAKPKNYERKYFLMTATNMIIMFNNRKGIDWYIDRIDIYGDIGLIKIGWHLWMDKKGIYHFIDSHADGVGPPEK